MALETYQAPFCQGATRDIAVLFNPTRQEFDGFFNRLKQNFGILRGLICENGDIFVWDPYDASHDFMERFVLHTDGHYVTLSNVKGFPNVQTTMDVSYEYFNEITICHSGLRRIFGDTMKISGVIK